MSNIWFLLFILLSPIISFGQNKKSLRNELLEIYRTDQHYREQLSKMGLSDPNFMNVWSKQSKIDSINLLRVIQIIDSIGYPGKSMVGETANEAVFLVIQHSELKYQEKYLPLIKKVAESGELAWKHVAKMIDRVLVEKGEKQIYGTQISPIKDPKTGFLTDRFQFSPIEGPKNVNKRRREVGLETIQEQAKAFGIQFED